MKQFTLTYKHRGTNALLTAKVFCDSLVGAEKALLEWEGRQASDNRRRDPQEGGTTCMAHPTHKMFANQSQGDNNEHANNRDDNQLLNR